MTDNTLSNGKRAALYGLQAVTGRPLYTCLSNHGQVQVMQAGKVLDRFTAAEWRDVMAAGTPADNGRLVINW